MGKIKVDAGSLLRKMKDLQFKAPLRLRREWWWATERLYIKSQNKVHTRTGALKASGQMDVTGGPGWAFGHIEYGQGLSNHSGHGYAVFEMFGGGYFKEGRPGVPYEQEPGWGHTPLAGPGTSHDFMEPVRDRAEWYYTRAMVKAMKG